MTRDQRIPPPPGATTNAEIALAYQPQMTKAIGRFYAAAMRLHGLDPVITEAVRIRCARTHDCRLCKALRYRPAREAGVDEDILTQVDNYESAPFDERLKVALRYTDMFLTAPGTFSHGLSEQMRRHFTEAEVVALTLEIMRFSTQKQYVTLGLDVLPGVDVESGALTPFDLDDSGRMVTSPLDA